MSRNTVSQGNAWRRTTEFTHTEGSDILSVKYSAEIQTQFPQSKVLAPLSRVQFSLLHVMYHKHLPRIHLSGGHKQKHLFQRKHKTLFNYRYYKRLTIHTHGEIRLD